jgi:3-isopropylmalate dehydratase small subunit
MSTPFEIRGRVVQMPDDLNTDVLHPSRFYSLDRATVKAGLRAGPGPDSDQPEPSIIIGGRNFGYGSSRETTLQSLRLNGFQLVIATTISRIFWRNAVNAGVWVLEAGDHLKRLRSADELIVHPELGRISSVDGTKVIVVDPPDAYDLAVLRAGGLLPWLASPGQPL